MGDAADSLLINRASATADSGSGVIAAPGQSAMSRATTLDAVSRQHHDALMRTTIDLPEDLHQLALAWARHQGSTLSQAVSDLINRGLEQRPLQVGAAPFRIDPLTSLPVVRSSRLITAEDVVAIEDAGR